jgi:hypothetical protein
VGYVSFSNSNEYWKDNKIPLQGRSYRDEAGEPLEL